MREHAHGGQSIPWSWGYKEVVRYMTWVAGTKLRSPEKPEIPLNH